MCSEVILDEFLALKAFWSAKNLLDNRIKVIKLALRLSFLGLRFFIKLAQELLKLLLGDIQVHECFGAGNVNPVLLLQVVLHFIFKILYTYLANLRFRCILSTQFYSCYLPVGLNLSVSYLWATRIYLFLRFFMRVPQLPCRDLSYQMSVINCALKLLLCCFQ